MTKGLTPALEQGIIKGLVARHFDEKDVDALTQFVFEVLSYKKMKFSEIIDELRNVQVCHSCGEATYEEFMIDTEGLPNGGYGTVCDYCYGNGR